MKWPKYERYKASEIGLAGDIPGHWQAGTIRRFALMKTGHTPSRTEAEYWEDCDIPWFTLADVWQLRGGRTYLGETKERISKLGLANSAAELLPVGTVILSRTASVGFSGIMPIPMATSQDFWNWVPSGRLLSKYLLHLLRSMRQEFERITMGSTHKTIYQPDAARLAICVPPLPEQRAIADFLDRETAKVDALVEKKRALIEKLAEKRSALISRAVTRGLPPDAARAAGLEPHPKLKPSGVEWLGDVPKSWEVRKFSREVAIAGGQVDPEIEPYASMTLIAPNHIESNTGRLLALETAAEQAAESGKYLCRRGDVVYSKIRPALAKVAIAPEDGLCSADMYPMRSGHRLSNFYLGWLLLSQQFTAWSVLEADRVAMPKINRETLSELRLPIPPLPEQDAIASYLDRETAKIDALVAKVEAAIDRLQEYRAALITAAVTGKIDVRGAAGAAPSAA